jgi:hypothetical protein
MGSKFASILQASQNKQNEPEPEKLGVEDVLSEESSQEGEEEEVEPVIDIDMIDKI